MYAGNVALPIISGGIVPTTIVLTVTSLGTGPMTAGSTLSVPFAILKKHLAVDCTENWVRGTLAQRTPSRADEEPHEDPGSVDDNESIEEDEVLNSSETSVHNLR